jgi:rubrerythrin
MIDIEVLKLALSKEEEAIKLYQSMIMSNPGVKELLYILVTEEQKHKVLLEKRIADLTRQ